MKNKENQQKQALFIINQTKEKLKGRNEKSQTK